ncbi:radical SAM family heme chaperone HemW [Candidatus Symbiothrix dinenymphae]|uniref:radical SAM family heme chaperone HemW n=1 Tax=Candidatus Symbiothrix dinenymphae TaxID=467085 RepID=UPI0006C0FB28|nr:radical SAM family heme chaperone HemW [Candidatus Symbiothrix dinenymphae]GAP71489.1 oxygen-independent coproporphyrinogen III oxidase [Candidatus Symbiothrix dinenymphae]
MAGIYFHIPFCKTRCIYCDFFSVTSYQLPVGSYRLPISEYVEALCCELRLRCDYLQNQPVDTIYFGGGTPTQLSAAHFEKIFSVIAGLPRNPLPKITLKITPEVTLEANPDDLTAAYLENLRPLPFNRLSIGVQSFNDSELKFLHRRHDAQTAIEAVTRAQKCGFDNISIDLMYGLPNQTLETWQSTLNQAIALGVQHISAYHIIYEEGTVLHKLLEQKKITEIGEETSLKMFEMLIDTLAGAGFVQYEISNFALSGYESRHNSAYWSGKHYLGIGAAAHSYNGVSRQWNSYQLPVTSFQLPVSSYHSPSTFHPLPSTFHPLPFASYLDFAPEVEVIDARMAYNDFIITRLRTMRGIDLDEMASLFGSERRDKCLQHAKRYLAGGLLTVAKQRLCLSRAGIFVSDGIMADLMI